MSENDYLGLTTDTYENDSNKDISDYIEKIASRTKLGHTSEHTFRKDLEDLINKLAPNVTVTNEPSQVTDCGNPDFLISRKDIPIGFIEAKDIGKDLKSKQYKEQFDRYKAALDNLIITDYLHFQFFVRGELVHEIKIGEVVNEKTKSVIGYVENYNRLAELLKDFCIYIGQNIKSAQRLAVLMAGKARLLENTLYNAVISDEDTESNTDLREQYQTFKSVLIHDLTPSEFADIYAQTLAYGMFAARLHDDDLSTFSRQEAAERIPKTNPFLRRLFDSVAGNNIDERIRLTVDNLAEVFRAAHVADILQNFGRTTQTQDPIIHFYETFLAEYNPKLRKQRGVWYTPEPVVKFIVRAVDDILKSEFNLADGIADTSKVEVEKETQTRDSRTKSGFKSIKELVHKVQILDPATGTGTFLAAIIQHIFHSQFENMGGIWSSYVEQDLLPRLHGFELLMASYAMAHLKLDMLLTDTGYQPIKPKRLQVYLTNSLEEHHSDTGTIFAGWLSAEANEANAIKRDAPVMVVIGNPPYSVSSSNKSEWIEGLMGDYKKDLNERNIQPLSDDYIKFIRYGQHYIEKNGEGILAFITNNSFVDGIIHRKMRKNLLETFDKTYIVNLHGNARKQETAPDGSKDENVFDIMAGVSINIFIKTKKHTLSQLGQVFTYDLFGKRDYKYQILNESNINTIEWQQVNVEEPEFYFIKQDSEAMDVYKKGFSLTDLMSFGSSGTKTHRDSFLINPNRISLEEKVKLFFNKEETNDNVLRFCDFKAKPGWLDEKREGMYDEGLIKKVSYRPFDNCWIYYSNDLVERSRQKTLHHMLHDNVGLLMVAQPQVANDDFFDCLFISKYITDTNFYRRGGPSVYPLYIYDETYDKSNLLDTNKPVRKPNLNTEIVADIAKGVELNFIPEKLDETGTFAPLDVLDYIYAVLHNPTYRATYKEFLKIDFPRVPYPNNTDKFWQLVDLGGQLRQVHLLESPKLTEQIKLLSLNYPKAGNNEVTRKMTKNSVGFEPNETNELLGKVWINNEQYFDNVPLVAWDFHIGGYQPAQKWLKDRQGRTLNTTDIKHYMNIIASLSLTDKLMQEIDEIDVVG